MKKLCWLAAILLLVLGSAVSMQAQAATPAATPEATEAVPLTACADLTNANLQVHSLGDAVKDGAVYCREIAGNGTYLINPGAIGDQTVIDQGVVQAYNVFGLTEAGTAVQRFGHPITVCLQGRGQMMLIPSFAAPDFVETPPAYRSGGFTCAAFESPGVVALVNEGE